MKPLLTNKPAFSQARRPKVLLAYALPRLTLPFAALLVCLLLACIGYTARKQTALAKFKAELKAKGEKLTFAELTDPAASTVNASQALLMNVGSNLNQYSLGPGCLELMVYTGAGRAQVAWKQDSPPWMASAGPGGPRTWEEFNGRIAEASESLAILRQGLTQPVAHWAASANLAKGQIPNLVWLRLTAQWLTGEAISNLRQGRLEAALQDLEALGGCAQVNREDYCLVSQMIRVAVTGLGLSVTWEALQAPGWTEPQLERLHRAWEPVDLIDAIETGFIAERANGEEIWARAHQMSGRRLRMTLPVTGPTNVTLATVFTDSIQFPAYRLTNMDEDEMFFLRCIQDSIDRIRRVKMGQPWIESEDGLSLGATKMSNLSGFKGRFRFWISMSAMPNFTRAVQYAAQNETLRQLTLAAIAIKRFQLRYGYLPADLTLLSPEFLAHPTYDPMSGKPLQYILRYDGGFTLYSAGKDHRDDGGERPFWFRGKFGLWDELDAVWPEGETTSLSASRR